MIVHKELVTLKEKFPWCAPNLLPSLWLKTSVVSLLVMYAGVYTWFVFGFGFVSVRM